MIAAVLDASKFIDVMANRKKVAEIIADKCYVNCPVDVIDQRLEGNYDNGIGGSGRIRLHEGSTTTARSNLTVSVDGMWFLTQHRRWGLLKRPGLPRRRAEGEPGRDLQAGAALAKVRCRRKRFARRS
jgi:nitrate/nitrite transport system substrate-binding protein